MTIYYYKLIVIITSKGFDKESSFLPSFLPFFLFFPHSSLLCLTLPFPSLLFSSSSSLIFPPLEHSLNYHTFYFLLYIPSYIFPFPFHSLLLSILSLLFPSKLLTFVPSPPFLSNFYLFTPFPLPSLPNFD